MEHRFCLDEILGKVSEMINDGYHYGLQMVRPE